MVSEQSPRESSITEVTTAAYKVPTDQPESDGTLQWEATTLVTVHASAGGRTGFGYTYASSAAATLIREKLAGVLEGRDAFDVTACWEAMIGKIRNVGRPGIASMAISAVDCALWDLKAKLLELPLIDLWGAVREAAPIYGSGGFTSYDDARLREQLAGWVEQGIPRVKLKVGRDAAQDPGRVREARRAIGDDVQLMVDANGGYTRKAALALGQQFAEQSGVVWYEEPRSSDDLAGLRLMRDRGPAGMDIAAGEYGYTPMYFRQMLEAGAVDCLQADATRCGGFTGFFKAATLCEAFHVPLSAHCAPQLHAQVACSAGPLRHVEYFHDHVRIASLLFDGVLPPQDGALRPDRSRPGIGLELKHSDAEKYRTE